MTSVKFGTSGVRGLVSDLTDPVCAAFSAAFLAHLSGSGKLSGRPPVLIGRDLRESSERIAAACAAGAALSGFDVINAGAVPTPALALEAMSSQSPAIMVTGSHIPADRNGLKFYRPDGEIDKSDERSIVDAFGTFGASTFAQAALPAADDGILRRYVARYAALGAAADLSGLAIGVYQHSSVARDALAALLEELGARVTRLGRADHFIPIDTEAVSEGTRDEMRAWWSEGRFDAIVSTDGDADRPLVMDDQGTVVRGDILGTLTAWFLRATTVVTPVTSSSAIELSGLFGSVVRTRVGSPYVIEGMTGGAGIIVGFEANGGVLLGSDVSVAGVRLSALPTRDAFLPIVAVLALAKREATSLSALVRSLPERRTASALIPETPADVSGPLLARLANEPGYAATLLAGVGTPVSIDTIDGVKIMLHDGSSVHFRASGNAPELRCYTEADSQDVADLRLAGSLRGAREALLR